MTESFKENMLNIGASEALGAGDTKFKLKDGANRFRLLSAVEPIESSYQGGPLRTRFVCWVLDRADKTIKLAFFPKTIIKAIYDLSTSEDYAFDELPMSRDLTISAKNAGTINAEYSVLPAPQETPLTSEERDAYSKEKPITEIAEQIRAKKASGAGPAGEIDAEAAA